MKTKKHPGFFTILYTVGFTLGIIFALLALLFSFFFEVNLSDISSSPVWKQDIICALFVASGTFFIWMCIGSYSVGDRSNH